MFTCSLYGNPPPPPWTPNGGENIFAEKSFGELLRCTIVYKACSIAWLVKWTPLIIRAASSIFLHRSIFWLIKNTIFEHFCGGETIDQVSHVSRRLRAKKIGVIVDYAAEPSHSPSQIVSYVEADYCEDVRRNVLQAIDAAVSVDGSYVAVKLSGLFAVSFLQKFSAALRLGRFRETAELASTDMGESYRVGWERLISICEYAVQRDVRLAIDAEQSFIQDSIDRLGLDIMKLYNSTLEREHPIILVTYQMYRKDGFDRFKRHLHSSHSDGFHFGVKIVRGAYVVGERIWAMESSTDCPIWDSAEETHQQFDRSLEYFFEFVSNVPDSDPRRFDFIIATHNTKSMQKATSLLVKNQSILYKAKVSFAQLYGMCDSISHSLANSGFRVFKYVPFGPVEKVVPYLIRRAEENSTIFRHSQSDASLVWKELKSRALFKQKP